MEYDPFLLAGAPPIFREVLVSFRSGAHGKKSSQSPILPHPRTTGHAAQPNPEFDSLAFHAAWLSSNIKFELKECWEPMYNPN